MATLREAAEKALETLEYLAQREHPQTNIVTNTHRIFPHRMMTEAAKELRAALAAQECTYPACLTPSLECDRPCERRQS